MSRQPPAPEQSRASRSTATARDCTIDGLALVVICVLLAEVLNHGHGWLRAVSAVAFLTFVPGWAVATNWPGMKDRSMLGFPVALSLVLLTLGATIELWAGRWDPTALVVAECALCAAGLAVGSGRRLLGNRRSTLDSPDRLELDDG